MTRQTALIWLVCAVIVAAVLRLWQLDAMPTGFYHDEAYNGLDALSLLEGRTFPQFYEGWELYRIEAHGERGALETRTPLFFEGNYGREPLHIYLMALSLRLFGPSSFAVRLVPALAGVLAVVTTAYAVQQLAPLEHRRAIVVYSAFAVAILFPAVHFSRFGLRAMLFVPIETLCVAFFWRGMRTMRWRDFVLAGLLLGGGLYVYAAGRMMPLLFALFCGWQLWQADTEARRTLFGRFAITAITATTVAAPVLLYFANYPYFLLFRSAYVAQNGAGVVAGQPLLTALFNVGRVVRGFIWLGETHLRHNLPGRAYFDGAQLWMAIMGLVAIANWRSSPRRLFVALWGIIMLLPSILSGDAPHFGRMTGFVPVAALLIGSGAVTIQSHLLKSDPRRAGGLIVVLFTLSTFLTGYDYFVNYRQHPQIAIDFYQSDQQLGAWLATLPANSDLYLTPTREELATILFELGDGRTRLRNYAGEAGIVLYGQLDTPTYHVAAADDMAGVARLTQLGQPVEVPFDAWRVFEIGPIAFTPQGTVENNIAIEAQITPHGETLHVTLRWQPQRLLADDWTAFVHVLGAEGDLVAQRDRPPAGYPTSDWQVGELIEDTFIIEAGLCETCQIVTGFYLPATGERLGEPLRVR